MFIVNWLLSSWLMAEPSGTELPTRSRLGRTDGRGGREAEGDHMGDVGVGFDGDHHLRLAGERHGVDGRLDPDDGSA